MQLTKRAEYAVLSALYLAKENRLCDLHEIAGAQRLPAPFAAKILQMLARAGILGAKRGQGGGYYLARPTHEVSLLEMIDAVEGPLAITDCLKSDGSCGAHACELEPIMRDIQHVLRSKLLSITLADIAGISRHAPAAGGAPAGRHPVVLCDFDGTISMLDVSDTIFTRWLGRRWAEIDREWHDGKISMAELYEKCWSLVDAGEAALLDFIDSVAIDPYFDDFIEYSRERSVPVYLVSDGFDFYIERIMGRYGLSNLEYSANRLRFDGGRPTPEFPNQHPDCILCANCKKAVMDEKRQEGDYVIYIGNGLSDRCAAEHADLVFAKDSLLVHCEVNGISCVPYNDFGEIVAYLKEHVVGETIAATIDTDG